MSTFKPTNIKSVQDFFSMVEGFKKSLGDVREVVDFHNAMLDVISKVLAAKEEIHGNDKLVMSIWYTITSKVSWYSKESDVVVQGSSASLTTASDMENLLNSYFECLKDTMQSQGTLEIPGSTTGEKMLVNQFDKFPFDWMLSLIENIGKAAATGPAGRIDIKKFDEYDRLRKLFTEKDWFDDHIVIAANKMSGASFRDDLMRWCFRVLNTLDRFCNTVDHGEIQKVTSFIDGKFNSYKGKVFLNTRTSVDDVLINSMKEVLDIYKAAGLEDADLDVMKGHMVSIIDNKLNQNAANKFQRIISLSP